MKTISKLVVFVGMLALAATPSLAADPPTDLPDQNDNPGVTHRPADTPPENTPPENQGTENKPETPGPRAGLPAKAKAYGHHCKGESKKRSEAAEGTKGTPFSQCVTAMAKLATGKTSSPRVACKELGKKREAGHHGTPFSLCVAGGAKLLREQRAHAESAAG